MARTDKRVAEAVRVLIHKLEGRNSVQDMESDHIDSLSFDEIALQNPSSPDKSSASSRKASVNTRINTPPVVQLKEKTLQDSDGDDAPILPKRSADKKRINVSPARTKTKRSGKKRINISPARTKTKRSVSPAKRNLSIPVGSSSAEREDLKKKRKPPKTEEAAWSPINPMESNELDHLEDSPAKHTRSHDVIEKKNDVKPKKRRRAALRPDLKKANLKNSSSGGSLFSSFVNQGKFTLPKLKSGGRK